MIIALGQWTLLIADRNESLFFGLLIQFNAFLVCSLFIPAQYHLLTALFVINMPALRYLSVMGDDELE